MKIILSRKGFDSNNGGYPCPILPDGRLVSLPIPGKSGFHYHEVHVDSTHTYFDIMHQLSSTIKINGVTKKFVRKFECHLDPDLIFDAQQFRHQDWKPLFGQVGSAGGHLRNMKVGPQDIFLFFGWFKQTRIATDGRLKFKPNAPDLHLLFGYLQVERVVKADSEYVAPTWMGDHPHLGQLFRKKTNNTIYIARKNLIAKPELPGAGAFTFCNKLVLTSPEARKRTAWKLPDFFQNCRIPYINPNGKSDRFSGSSNGFVNVNANIGQVQELVITDENQDNSKIVDWAYDKIM